jgi:gp16 family phage-associated protein
MPSQQHSLRTPEEAREWLERHGVPVSDWARAHGFDPTVVFSLLSGRTRGRRGIAYAAAIALGLRAPPSDDEAPPLDDLRENPSHSTENSKTQAEGDRMF